MVRRSSTDGIATTPIAARPSRSGHRSYALPFKRMETLSRENASQHSTCTGSAGDRPRALDDTIAGNHAAERALPRFPDLSRYQTRGYSSWSSCCG
jgi:hypothetical protein